MTTKPPVIRIIGKSDEDSEARRPIPFTSPWDELTPSNDEVLDATRCGPILSQSFDVARTVVRIGPDAVAKAGVLMDHEAAAMSLVRRFTSIPVPRVHRIIPYARSGRALLVMQFIKGETLDKCWHKLSIWRRIWVVWTLRQYVRQMRAIPNPQPGIPGLIGSEPSICAGNMFGEESAGPFRSYDEMTAWLNRKLQIAKTVKGRHAISASSPEFDNSFPLVFTHNDLKPANIILGEDNKLWLIDFGTSGFYPLPYEYVGMIDHWANDYFLPLRSRLVRAMVGFISGFYARWYASYYRPMSWILWYGYYLE